MKSPEPKVNDNTIRNKKIAHQLLQKPRHPDGLNIRSIIKEINMFILTSCSNLCAFIVLLKL